MNMKSVVGLVAIIVLLALLVLFLSFPGCSSDYGGGKYGLVTPAAGAPAATAFTPSSETIATGTTVS